MYAVRGTRTACLWLQCFGEAVGDQNVIAILDRVRAGAKLPSVKQALNTAGIGVGSSDPTRFLGRSINRANFEPRGILEIYLHLSSEISELGTFIQTAELVNEIGV
jgi:hypothetical protein